MFSEAENFSKNLLFYYLQKQTALQAVEHIYATAGHLL